MILFVELLFILLLAMPNSLRKKKYKKKKVVCYLEVVNKLYMKIPAE